MNNKQLPEAIAKEKKRSFAVIIDDDQLTRVTLERLFRKAGYSVQAFANGRLALDWLTESPEVSFIILDLDMPIMGGSEFMRELKLLPPALSSVPVILHSSGANAVISKNMGCSGFIKKPVKVDKLLCAVLNLVGIS